MIPPCTLYGLPHSLYTGKTRSYLRKQGIAYVERTPLDPGFRERILPVVGWGVVPVVELADGSVIQDTTDILDHFEDRGVPLTARPPGALQRVLGHVTELYAVVGLTRHAMHYRWSYFGDQEAFLRDAFVHGAGPDGADRIMDRMRAYLPALGVTPHTVPAIEASYLRLLDLLNSHLSDHPYLLGGQASVGDYGLLGPLFAHLGRDPVPASLMKTRAPKVFRWVERMNASDADMPEFEGYGSGYLPEDAVPEILRPVFSHMAEELFPELTDYRDALTDHLKTEAPKLGTPVSARPHQRILRTVPTTFRGARFDGGLQPYVFHLWQRVRDAFDAAPAEERPRVHAWLSSCGLAALVDEPLPARIERRGGRDVLASL